MLQNNNTKQVVLIGYIGHGKTTLFNKICNKNQAVKLGGPSVTRESVLCQSAYGDGFNLIDTPGLGTDKDKLGHVVCIATALTYGQVHQILIVVMFERLATMKERLRPMIQQQFKRFKDIITVVVTHWDRVDEPEIRKQELVDLIKGYTVRSMILVSLQTQGKELCQMIEGILENCDQQGKSCQLYFIKIIINFIFFFFKQLNTYSVKFDKIIFPQADPTTHEVMHQLELSIKDYTDQTILKFEKVKMFIYIKSPIGMNVQSCDNQIFFGNYLKMKKIVSNYKRFPEDLNIPLRDLKLRIKSIFFKAIRRKQSDKSIFSACLKLINNNEQLIDQYFFKLLDLE